jgi:hypothetical protein
MSAIRWLCGECLYGGRNTSDDVSGVRIRPTSDGGFVVAGERMDKPPPGQAALPCLSLEAAEMVIVSEHYPARWDPINLSSEIHRV